MSTGEAEGLGIGEAELRAAIRRWRDLKRKEHKVDGVDQSPGCVFGLVTRDALDNLAGDLDDIKAELKWIRRVIVGAVVSAGIATVLRFAGWG